MESSAEIAGEFASAMQQLSAEAAKSLPQSAGMQNGNAMQGQLAHVLQRVRAFNERLDQLETTIAKNLEKISSALPAPEQIDFAPQFQKLDEKIAAVRKAESVNQRLFDSLHEELIKYRDDFLRESLQKPFIRDLVVLFDDLSGLSSQLTDAGNAGAKRGALGPWRDNLENAIHALIEILHRLEVKEIEAKDKVDLAVHRVVSYEPTKLPEEDGRIVMRVKRGFLWRDGGLRPEEVIAKRYN